MTKDLRPPQDNETADSADNLLDRAIESARVAPTPEQSSAARARVRATLFAQQPRASSPCDQLSSDIAALVAGDLTEDRATLVADHCRECVPCRKQLIAARDGSRVAVGSSHASPAIAPRSRRRILAPLAGMAAAIAIVGFVGFVALALQVSDPPADATLAEIRGIVLDASSGEQLPQGTLIAEGQAIRTGKGSRAVLALPDGSRVELNERAQVAFDQDGEALTLALERGDIIFDAAPRRQRNLFVRTDDCMVSVKGTVFTVRHGLKGSRIGVLEGSVQVAASGQQSLLGPGQQVATDPSLTPQSLGEQVAWSLDSERWTTLLTEIESAARAVETSRVPREPRFESAILDAMPDSTVLFAALPNDGELSDLASEISERVASHPELSDWWQSQLDPASSKEPGFARLLDSLRRVSDALGEEVVFALIETGGVETPPAPVLAAGIRDEAGLRQLVADLAAGAAPPRLLSAGELALEPKGMLREPLLVLHAGHVLVGPSADALQALVAGFDGDAPHGTRFLASLEGHYDRGADFLVAADLARTLGQRALSASNRMKEQGNETPSLLVQALGITSVEQFVLTASETDPGTAVLSFNEDRQGVASWLAEPGPMGSLQFVSADAVLATAALFQEPERMFADIQAMLPAGKLDELLSTMMAETGVDVRGGLVGSLGGEMALALDGPLLPHPSWKLILEIDDPAGFEQALHGLAEHAAALARERGMSVPEVLIRETKTSEGPAHALMIGPMEIHYALVGGYFVAVPNLQLLEIALQARSRGSSLATSPRLVELLPGGQDDQLSLIAWQDAGRMLNQFSQGAGAGLVPADVAPLLSAAASGPTLGWGRAGSRAISFGVNGADGGLGGGVAAMLRRHVVEGLSRHALTARAAAGEDAFLRRRVE